MSYTSHLGRVRIGIGVRDKERIVNNCMLDCVNIGLVFKYAVQFKRANLVILSPLMLVRAESSLLLSGMLIMLIGTLGDLYIFKGD